MLLEGLRFFKKMKDESSSIYGTNIPPRVLDWFVTESMNRNPTLRDDYNRRIEDYHLNRRNRTDNMNRFDPFARHRTDDTTGRDNFQTWLETSSVGRRIAQRLNNAGTEGVIYDDEDSVADDSVADSDDDSVADSDDDDDDDDDSVADSDDDDDDDDDDEMQLDEYLNVQDPDGRTALHLASVSGHEDTVQILLNAGSATNLQDNEGFTALHLASKMGHEGVVRLLLNAGSATNLLDHDGRTALHRASEMARPSEIGNEGVVRLLRDEMPIEERFEWDVTLVMERARCNRNDAIDALNNNNNDIYHAIIDLI